MNILCLCYEYPPVGGGGASVCQGLSEALVAAGHKIDLVTSGIKNLPPYEEVRGVHIHRVRCHRPQRHYATTLQLATMLYPSYRKALQLYRERRHDVAHCHFVVPTGFVAYYLNKKTGLPYLLTAHGSDIPGYNPDRFKRIHPLIRPIWRRIIRASACLTSPSRFLESLILRHIDTPITIIPNGYDPPIYKQGNGRRKRILVASRLVERKGIQFLIRALEGLDIDWEVCIAGDGPYLSNLKSLVAELGVKVRFLGFVDRCELEELYRTARVFVFTSSQENFPMVLLEAMAAGCAIITSATPGCIEVVGNAAVTVPPKDHQALHNALKLLLSNPDEIKRLGSCARERAAEFTWSKIAIWYEDLLEKSV